MPKYRVLAKSFINSAIVQEGEIVEYDGEPSENLELVESGKTEGKRGRKAAESDAGEASAPDLV